MITIFKLLILIQGCFFFFFFSVYIVCRRGNDSQRAVKLLKESLGDQTDRIKDIIGGIHAWTHKIDPKFPIY